MLNILFFFIRQPQVWLNLHVEMVKDSMYLLHSYGASLFIAIYNQQHCCFPQIIGECILTSRIHSNQLIFS